MWKYLYYKGANTSWFFRLSVAGGVRGGGVSERGGTSFNSDSLDCRLMMNRLPSDSEDVASRSSPRLSEFFIAI